MICVRCGDELREGTYQGVPLRRCVGCGGVLVEIRHNVPLLEALAANLAADVDPYTEIEATHGPAETVACPSCRSDMERFGYVGTPTVYLDRCGPCLLLWIDAEEITTLAAVFARTQRRTDDRRDFELSQYFNQVRTGILRND